MLYNNLVNQMNRNPGSVRPVRSAKTMRANSSVMGIRTPLAWHVQQYVYDRGGAYEPAITDFTTSLPVAPASVEHHVLTAGKGSMIDADYEQYSNKMYTVRLTTDQDMSVAIQINYFEQIVIVVVQGGVETTVYTTGTDDNIVRRLILPLDFGITDVHIMTYAGSTGRRLEAAVDLTGVRSCAIPSGSVGQGGAGGWTIPYNFSTDTGGTPEDTYLEYDHATPASVTAIYADDNDRLGVDVDALLDTFNVGDSIKLVADIDSTIWHIYTIISAADSGAFHTFGVTYSAGNGTFADEQAISLSWTARGAVGGWTIPYKFGTDTDGTPTSTYLEYNHAVLANVTKVYPSDTDRNGVDVDSVLDVFDVGDSIKIFEDSVPSNWHIFAVTAATDTGTYHTLGVTYLSGNGTFDSDDNISLSWTQIGDIGPTGLPGPTGLTITGPIGHTGVAITGAAITGAAITGAAITGAAITGPPGPTGVAITGAAITGAAITGAAITGAAITGAAITGAAITGAAITGSIGPTGAAITGAVGEAPEHEWSATLLRFRNPGGTWGDFTDLLGPTGPIGPTGLTITGPPGATGAAITGAAITGTAITGSAITGSAITGPIGHTGAAITGSAITGAAITGAAITGPLGPTGLTITGPIGHTGAAITGAAITGAAITGSAITGPPGATGLTITGPRGATGAAITGVAITGAAITGAAITGPPGTTGLTITGPPGATGAAITGVAITGPAITGPPGTTGLTVTGPIGPTGAAITGPVVTGPAVTGPAVTGPIGPTGAAITGVVGEAPLHEWLGTLLRFQLPGETWGDYTDLVGATGPKGTTGVAVTGPAGSTGVAITGAAITGAAGTTGVAVTGVAVTGVAGPTGAAITGPAGATGVAITGAAITGPAGSSADYPPMFVDVTGLRVGVQTNVPDVTLDVDGHIRAFGVETPSAGTGTELGYDSVNKYGQLLAIDRAGPTYKDLLIDAKDISLNYLSGGNVGVGGIASPTRKLHVYDNSGPQLRLDRGGGDRTDFEADSDGNLIIEPDNVRVGVNMTPETTLDLNGSFRATGSDPPSSGTGVEIFYSGGIGGIASVTRPLTFRPLTIASSVLTINTLGGNVGVNTASPDRPLDVEDSSGPQERLTHSSGDYTDLETDSNGNYIIAPSGGIVTLDGQSAVSVYLSSDQNILANVATTVEFNSELYDVQGEFNTSTHIFSPVEDGKYLVSCSIVFENPSAGDQLWVELDVGGITKLRTRRNTVTTDFQSVNLMGVLDLNAGQSVVVVVENSDSDDVIDGGAADTWLQITKLH